MIPPKLRQGDTIAVFSPSAPITATVPSRYLRGKSFLETKGFRVVEGSLTGKLDGYRSGSIQERAEELNQLLRDPNVRCIMSAIGGYNSNALLPYIDYDALRADPKIIIGYSDVTALLLGIYAQTGLTTYYGPAMAASFGEFPPFVDETYHYFTDILSENASFPHLLPTPAMWTEEWLDWSGQTRGKVGQENQLVTIQSGKSVGRLIGGNLNTLGGIWGTPYMPEIQPGDILLLEDSLLDAAITERSFAHLHLAGVFDRIGGLILGKHEQFNDQGIGRKPYEILEEVIGKCSFPILAEFDCCHTHPMLTLPIGSLAALDADEKTVTILQESL